MADERHVKSVVLTPHPDLWEWVQDTLPNFSRTMVLVLYALRKYYEATNSTSAALDALLEEIERAGEQPAPGGGPARAGLTGDPDQLRQIIRQELQRALAGVTAVAGESEPEADDEAWTAIEANLEAIL